MWSIVRPSQRQRASFVREQQDLPFTYKEVGLTQNGGRPEGFLFDHHQVVLGQGEQVFERACIALQAWKMFPAWAEVSPASTPQPGLVVAVVFRLLGMYWKSSARVVYCLDETSSNGQRRFGFAYGTLPGHVECGEELFSVVSAPDGTVRYEIIAFSRPRFWMARWAKPLARRWQLRFVRESQAAMKALCEEKITNI